MPITYNRHYANESLQRSYREPHERTCGNGLAVTVPGAGYLNTADQTLLSNEYYGVTPQSHCCSCAHEIPEGLAIEVESEARYCCADCESDHFCSCEHCVERTLIDETSSVRIDRNGRNVETWCEPCATSDSFVCADCGNRYHNDREESRGICSRCYENGDYFFCGGCNRSFHGDNYGSDGFCRDCEEQEHQSSRIHDYGYKPQPRWNGLRPNVIGGKPEAFIGVEIEVESGGVIHRRDIAEKVQEILGDNFYCKHDSSLRDGAEIVSHPFALKRFPFDRLRRLCRELKRGGARSHQPGTCGIHVHVSKNAIPGWSDDSAKNRHLMENIWRGLRVVRAEAIAVSKRESFTYCQMPREYSASNMRQSHPGGSNSGGVYSRDANEFLRAELRSLNPEHCTQCREDHAALIAEIEYRAQGEQPARRLRELIPDFSTSNNHGSAINFGNEHTIEVRFMRGTVNPESCVNSIKFAFHFLMFLATVKEFRLTAIEREKRTGAELWCEMLATLPGHLRDWVIARSETGTAYTDYARERASKVRVPISKPRATMVNRVLEVSADSAS